MSPKNALAKVKEASSRLVVLDLLRGYFLIVILLNHLHYYPSGLEWFTGQSYLYASTAEGFFLLSGVVLGLVRGAKLVDKPLKVATKLLLQRGVLLYVTGIILSFVFTFVGWAFLGQPGLKYGIFSPSGLPFDLIWQTLSLQYVYGWADFLRMYALFILVSPLALWLLRKGLWYMVLLGSFGIWLLYPFSPWPAGELSDQVSWAIIFFSGFVVGYHLKAIQHWWKSKGDIWRKRVVIAIWIIAGTTLIANALLVFGHGIPGIGNTLANGNVLLGDYFNKDRMPIPRLILFGIWFLALLFLVSKFERWVTKWLGWLLLPLGMNSLYVYIIQAFVVFFLLIVMPQPSIWPINLLVSLGAIGIIYIAVRTKFLMRVIPR